MSKKSFIKVQASILREIRKRYEFGESLKELAYEYRVNYGTLKNYASKEKWKKGSLKGAIYLQESTKEVEELKNKFAELLNTYRSLHISSLNHLINLEKTQKPVNDKQERAVQIRIQSLKESFLFAKDLYGVRTPEQELDYKRKKAEYEAWRDNLLEGNKEVAKENKGLEDLDEQDLDNILKKYGANL